MKRETKIGLIVAGAFLCCVGGYLGLRLRSSGGADQATTEPAEQMPAPTLTLAAAPDVQLAAAPNINPPSDPVIVPPPVAAFDPPPLQSSIVVPTPVELPKTEIVNPPETTLVPDIKPAPPLPETQQPIAPLPEFKSVEIKQDPPKLADPTPPVAPEPKTIEPLPIAKDLSKPEEPKPTPETSGSASLVAPTPPKQLPDPLPTLQPASNTRPVSKGPVSDSFLEEEYRLQTGDTFASVSKRFYYSDKYSIALQQYNRDYPIGSPNLRQDPPRLAAGTAVWIPPIRVLEKRYPTMIADYKPLPNAAVAGPATATAPGWTPAPARQVAATSKTYRVHDGGESMQDIARRTLGNPQAWNTIYQMNPTLNQNAAAPIPAGTLLRIPGDAKD